MRSYSQEVEHKMMFKSCHLQDTTLPPISISDVSHDVTSRLDDS